jgi:hypothetical protein
LWNLAPLVPQEQVCSRVYQGQQELVDQGVEGVCTTAWSQDLSGGEVIRSNYDQTVTVSPYHLQYLYQGLDPSSNQSYNLLPWRIGLATQTNSTS